MTSKGERVVQTVLRRKANGLTGHERDAVDRGAQLLVLRVQVPRRRGQAPVVHQHPDRLQVLAVGQERRGETVAMEGNGDRSAFALPDGPPEGGTTNADGHLENDAMCEN